MSWLDNVAQGDFERARRRARFAQLRSTINRDSNDLLPLNEVRSRLNVSGQRSLGYQVVPLTSIVGSESRYSDFDRSFLPRRDDMQSRWKRIDQAHYASVVLPPVDLYKIGEVYFVKDGNHRVSVARQLGQDEIEAYVTNLDVAVPLPPSVNMRDLILMEEYNDFLEWTNLHKLRPDQRIFFSELGGYLDLVHHINVHRYYLGQQQHSEISRDAAVTDWYDNIYLPVVHIIREQDALRQFSGRTEADLYRWVMDHRWYMRERNQGDDPGPQAATSDYVTLFGRKRLTTAVEDFLRNMITTMQAELPK